MIGTLALGLVLAVAACGRVPGSGANGTASPSTTTSESPSAHATPLTLPGPTFHMGEVAVGYAPMTVTASGGSAPYIWMIGGGALPDGLSISPDGVITGTPAKAGSFSFTIQVIDAAMATANLSGTIAVVPALAAGLVRPGAITVKHGSAASGAAFATQSGGTAPYAYALKAGRLPPGASLQGLALTGSYPTAGTYTFTIAITDGQGATVTVTPTVYVWADIAFPDWNTGRGQPPAGHMFAYADVDCRGTVAAGCSAQFAYSGGTPGVTPIVSSFLPPNATGQPQPALDGLTVTVSGGAVHVVIAPNMNPGGTWQVGVALTDPQDMCGDSTTAPYPCSTRNAYFRIEVGP
jgi:hypothetical protein